MPSASCQRAPLPVRVSAVAVALTFVTLVELRTWRFRAGLSSMLVHSRAYECTGNCA